VPPADPEPALTPWFILAVLIITLVGFVGTELFAQHLADKINDEALSIATNASPAIEHLSEARGELVRIAVAAGSAASSARSSGLLGDDDVAAVQAPLSALRQDLQRYLKQPFYPREDRRYAEVDRNVRALEASVGELRAAVAAGDRRRAVDALETGVLPAVVPVDRAIAQVVLLNAEQEHRLALEIPRQRRHAHKVEYWLQGVTGLLGLLLMSFVIRGIRAYALLLKRARAAARARDDLLAAVSHDLRNPINAITLTVRSMRRASPDSATEKQAARIERATERMSNLIADLLDAAKIEAGVFRVERKPENVAKLLESVDEMFRAVAEERSIRLISRPPAGDVIVPCERHLISRVLANLLSNAVKFSPEGASIVVVAERLPAEVQFAVSDEGPGIPAEHRSHVFDRYWQQKKGDRRGSGLGLYIAKGIVAAHGGRIWIDPPGHGTTARFALPLDPGRPAR
jgi:signal transduction histidine kinase